MVYKPINGNKVRKGDLHMGGLSEAPSPSTSITQKKQKNRNRGPRDDPSGGRGGDDGRPNGRGGNDTITGAKGDDTLAGGAGYDTLGALASRSARAVSSRFAPALRALPPGGIINPLNPEGGPPEA
jgi:hemolysin type calcium-binding protein